MCVAAAIAGAGVLGAGASIYSSNKAASAQKSAAQQATNTQQGMFDQTQANLQPYMDSGNYANNMLAQRLKELTSPISMDQATLEQTPGYQFNLSQGLKAVQNSASARGLGVSGAAEKGAAQYATGLADSTYQNQFQNAVTNQSNAYSRLMSSAGLGENAAAGLGNNAVTTGSNIGNNITGAANAAGGSYIAGSNAFGQAAQSIPNGLLANQFIQNGLYGGNPAPGANYGVNNSDYANGGSIWGSN